MANTAAQAQCAPDPTVADGTSTCSGSDSDGLVVSTDGSAVVVSSGATTGQLRVTIPAVDGVYAARTATISVLGAVDGGAQSGIVVQPGNPAAGGYDFYGTEAMVSVAAGAQVSGLYGVTADGTGTSYGSALVTLDNAGTISGTSGIALLAINPSRGGFASIDNAATGTIGAISGPIGTLDNAGVIDGGARSAIDKTTTYNGNAGFGTWTNSGTIRSNSATATIANLGQLQTLVNSGTIANSGSGAAIQGSILTVTNQAGGRISTGGSVAIAADTAITLVNAGTIVGDVVESQGYYTYYSSSIDSTAGQILGNVSLGSGDDLLYARYDGTATLVTGISGTIDGGAGTNRVVLAPTSDLSLTSAIALPGSFQRLRLAPGSGATLTLADGFVAPGTIEIAGAGTIVNETTVAVNGQAFVQNWLTSAGTLNNKGVIQAAPATYYYALDLDSSTLINSGRIESSGDGVYLSGGTLTNSGTIVAGGTAVYLFGEGFDNSGTIQSTGGIGVVLNGNTYDTATNSGRIEGATYGVVTSYILNNSGTISASGTAVGLDYYGILNNLAGGVIDGGTYAITGKDDYGSTGVYNGAVFNAGTINGDVSFVPSGGNSYGSSRNVFVALTGGVLNGNLTLGAGDTLVTDLVNTGSGSFAGINGTVSGTGALLRYRVSGEASAVIGAVGPFATTGYELVGGATLQLTADGAQGSTLVLAGSGTVDMNATIATTDQAAIQVVAAASVEARQTGGASSDALTIVNRGSISGTKASYYSGSYGVVVLNSNSVLENEGTIRAVYADTVPSAPNGAAVYYGASLINNGRIELDGSYGAYNVSSVVNTGTILQTGTRQSVAIYNASSVTNSGTIQTAGPAISGGYGTVVTNTGSIASIDTNGANSTAIAIYSGGRVENAGSILGDVSLGEYGMYWSNGGTLTGNLSLGSSSVLLISGDSKGISGTITATGSSYGRALTTSGSVAIGAAPGTGFTSAAVAAFGTGTVATLTSVDASFLDLRAMGDGGIVNQTAIAGSVQLGGAAGLGGSVDSVLGSFTNDGTIAGSVTGQVLSFTNNGKIGSPEVGIGTVGISNRYYTRSGLTFTNNGQIGTTSPVYLDALDAMAVSNTGTIEGGMQALVAFSTTDTTSALTVKNSGTIRAEPFEGYGTALALYVDRYSGATGTVSLDNSGTLVATGISATAASIYLGPSGLPMSYAVRNSGAITAVAAGASSEYRMATGILVYGPDGSSGTITNLAGGTISASGDNAVAVLAAETALTLNNAGRIAADGTGAMAIFATGDAAISITNTGTIAGATMLDAGVDLVDNAGTMGALSLGAGDDRVVLHDGAVNPLIDGGDGADRLEISGTAGGAAIALGSVTNIETLRMSGGLATVSGDASFTDFQLSGGRLVGLAGSTITAPTIVVGTGATFGSAGTVNGNIQVAGTLSPGASPGTMTVNGNVALAATSTSLFEMTPTVSDKLVVNGTLSIASGATLQIVRTGTVTPGTVLDLITASGGITGSFTNVLDADSGFGIFSQDGGRIRVMSTFIADPGFDGAARQGVAYVNGVLLSGQASASLLAAVPQLLTASGSSNAAAFVQITPQAYAAARQISVENGLTLADAARSQAFAPVRDTPGMFSFASALGGTRTLEGDPVGGTMRTTTSGYGFLAGIGYAGTDWSVGAFGGYLNDRQTLAGLGARTTADGAVAGVHARLDTRGIGFKATLAYDGAHADTRRSLPSGSASAGYGLHGWTADASVDTLVKLAGAWTLRPALGATAIRTTREGAAEGGNSPFALTVARQRETAVFVDGGMTFAGEARLGETTRVRPYLTLGARYQMRGRVPYAVAGLGGGGLGLEGEGAARAPLLATARLGADVQLSPRLVLFGVVSGESGDADHRVAARGGARLAF